MTETPNQIRERIQKDAAQRLETEKRLICRWGTGCGKSNIALWFIKWHPDFKTLIVVPEINNIENWWAEFDKFKVPRDSTTIICYASLKNYKDTSWGLLVLDEAPHVDTDLRFDIMTSIKAEHVLALGAVVSTDEQARLELQYGKFAESRITLDMAIEFGILPPPEVRVCHMTLDDTNRQYRYDGRECTAKGVYDALEAKVTNAVVAYNQNSNKWNLIQMQRLGSERKRFLGEQKTYALEFICNKLKEAGKRYICFCTSIAQAEKLGGSNSFTSHTPKSFDVLNKFNTHKIDSIYCVGKLIEGQNLVDIDCGVIGQLGGKERITIQSIGRIMRSSNPIVYVPIYDGTKDNGFMSSLTNSISSKYIKHYKL